MFMSLRLFFTILQQIKKIETLLIKYSRLSPCLSIIKETSTKIKKCLFKCTNEIYNYVKKFYIKLLNEGKFLVE